MRVFFAFTSGLSQALLRVSEKLYEASASAGIEVCRFWRWKMVVREQAYYEPDVPGGQS